MFRQVTLLCKPQRMFQKRRNIPCHLDEVSCGLPCGVPLPCGHTCTRPCHLHDPEDAKCTSMCTTVRSCGHPCNEPCHDSKGCPNTACKVMVGVLRLFQLGVRLVYALASFHPDRNLSNSFRLHVKFRFCQHF